MVVQGNDTQFLEQLVQQAVVLQDGHPGVGPQQEVHPHGQHDQYHGRAAEALALPAEKVRHRIAQQQADSRGNQRQLEGTAEHSSVTAHLDKVVQREAALAAGKGIHHHNDNGGYYKNSHPHHIGHGKTGELTLHPRSPPLPAQHRRPPVPRIPRSKRNSRRTYRNTRSSS